MFLALNESTSKQVNFISDLLSSPLAGVVVSFISAIIIYMIRQYWERRKLRIALITEVSEMDGIRECANQMERIGSPPQRQLTQDDMPAPGSIPTVVYEGSASNVGLLQGLLGKNTVKNAVQFYSIVIQYKGIIREIGQKNSLNNQPSGSGCSNSNNPPAISVSDNSQERLYNNIADVEKARKNIVEKTEFIDVSEHLEDEE